MSGIVHSDLAYRALLRNLRLLAGMRAAKQTPFRVFIAGVEADAVAERMSKLEKTLQIEVGGTDGSAVGEITQHAFARSGHKPSPTSSGLHCTFCRGFI
jgi:hypothetical protein